MRASARTYGSLMGSLAALLIVAVAGAPGKAAPARTLRVCSDPNNLPFSNAALAGFENRLAALVARELGATVEYTWWAQRRGFIRNTLNAGLCDVVMGVPSAFELALTTAPYYRSSYVFVTRAERELDLRSFDDPRLRALRVGVHIIGDDYANTPPAHALARRGIVDNLVGYSIYGDYREDSPPARLIEAVAREEVDVAVAWGPLAGYVAKRSAETLRITPVSAVEDGPVPLAFDISMGVRKGDTKRKAELERVLRTRRGEIRKLLEEYGVVLDP